ncbi:hypothetical protein SCLCIDRAFT_34052 [Scleroderma citrinum Foug A]|uniref:Uncharacterized protein n=1 Tax=Scleroderma citrinum Foug A TaxID=1036808 RepID=A0A0C3D2T0_9AGAM|nr:hypothetical protein SCLCIDRAFT_34052 [Scleroderma citrinum Foug A]
MGQPVPYLLSKRMYCIPSCLHPSRDYIYGINMGQPVPYLLSMSIFVSPAGTISTV